MKRTIAKRVLILCEDKKSSLLYFKSFKKDEVFKRELASVSIEIIHPKYFTPVALVSKAKELQLQAKQDKNPYGEIWVVMDKDNHLDLEDAIKIASNNKIRVALSVICFEYWVLLHFKKSMKSFSRCDDIQSYIKHNFVINYNKSESCFDKLKDKLNVAMENAIWSRNQLKHEFDAGKKLHELSVYTNIDELVRILIFPQKHLH